MNGYPHRSRYDMYESAGIDSKIVIMGNSGVGKTSLLYRYTQNRFDPKNTTSTSGAFFVTKKIFVDNVKVRLQLWDTAGQERFRSMAPMYYRGANAALVLYDITNPSTFQDVRGWLEELKKNCAQDLIIYVVGSKADLSTHRQVTSDFARLSLHNWFPPPRKAPPPPPPPPPPSTLSYIRPRFTSFPGISPRPQISAGEGQTSSSSLGGDLAHSHSISGRPSGMRRSQMSQQQSTRANSSSILQRPQSSRLNSHGYTALSDNSNSNSNSNSTNSINEEDEDDFTREDEEEWGLSKGMELFEVSAKDDIGITHLFNHLIKAIIERRDAIEKENELKKRDSVFLSTPAPTWAAQAEEEEAREKERQAARGGWSSSCC
ncbi:ras-like gtp-binding protein ryl2 [Moniliophthora roreri MCA 2997]|uniref:Ras-like gtp-binding protein ryl2 n=2 Tax=Moniliophthora roreri TaxID=221103 RepID=V2X3P0_MONRO|nr:ras-like gtp-binding protein ryl2 [Moniliophthora roreri MCA 2997]KAI3596801.1 ras-like gtp-binding protein ryl2 [Moniliophthora roreri]